MNTFPTKIITFINIGRSRKLDDQGSVKATKIMFAFKKFSDMFSRDNLRDYEHIQRSQKLDHQGSVKATKDNVCVQKIFRYVFPIYFERL